MNTATEVKTFLHQIADGGTYGSIVILVVAIVIAYWLSRSIGQLFIKIAQLIAVRADSSSNDERTIQLRKVETYLSITVALLRAVMVALIAYAVWRLLDPGGSELIATIGASTLFIVLASGTIGALLKDVMNGANMIIEGWFTIGDFIKIEPFSEMAGVVERATLRSTRLRGLNGEIIWVHNQYIQGVRVTPRGVRTIAVDIFVSDQEKATHEIRGIIDTMPLGPTMLAKKPAITATDQWADQLWRITVTGQTLPGREWLIDQYFIDALEELDDSLMVQKPITRNADPVAEKKFQRAVRVKK
jgi:small-conductance mechanosensitive channel